MNKKNILLSGGTGCLGSALLNVDPDIIAPTHDNFDITHPESRICFQYWFDGTYYKGQKPDTYLHCSGFVGNPRIDKNPSRTILDNIIGTANCVRAAMEHNIRFIFISTDYLHGEHETNKFGHYRETDLLDPVDKYGSWSKLAGEASVRLYLHNSLIIRTSFCPDDFYPDWQYVFTDSYTSKDKVSIIAPLIYKAAISDLTGILNIGTPSKSLAALAKSCGKNLPEYKLSDKPNVKIPRDTSFDLSRLNKELLKK